MMIRKGLVMKRDDHGSSPSTSGKIKKMKREREQRQVLTINVRISVIFLEEEEFL